MKFLGHTVILFNFLISTVAEPFYTPIHDIATESSGFFNLNWERAALSLFLVSLGVWKWHPQKEKGRRWKDCKSSPKLPSVPPPFSRLHKPCLHWQVGFLCPQVSWWTPSSQCCVQNLDVSSCVWGCPRPSPLHREPLHTTLTLKPNGSTKVTSAAPRSSAKSPDRP